MEPNDFDSDDKELLSWDINDMKLPQVCTAKSAAGRRLPLLRLEGGWGRRPLPQLSPGPRKGFEVEMQTPRSEQLLPRSYRPRQRQRCLLLFPSWQGPHGSPCLPAMRKPNIVYWPAD